MVIRRESTREKGALVLGSWFLVLGSWFLVLGSPISLCQRHFIASPKLMKSSPAIKTVAEGCASGAARYAKNE